MNLKFLKVFAVVCFLPYFILGCSHVRTPGELAEEHRQEGIASVERSRQQGIDMSKAHEDAIKAFKDCRKGLWFNDKETCYGKAAEKINEFRAKYKAEILTTAEVRSSFYKYVRED